MKIGNYLGSFIMTDMSFMETCHMRIARILVNIDIIKGFLEYIDLAFYDITIV